MSVQSKDNKQVLHSVDFFAVLYRHSPKMPSHYHILNLPLATSCEELSLDVVAQYGKAARINLFRY